MSDRTSPADPAPNHTPNHMTPDEFRREGHRMVDAIADYMRTVESMPVTPDAPPGTLLNTLPDLPPDTPEPWDDIHRDLNQQIIPNLTHWQHPGFFAYFSCNASGPGILGEIASAGLNVNGMLWSTSPAATELETRVLDWCRHALGLPVDFIGNGVIQGTASEATLIALLAAQRRARDAIGEQADRAVLITSTQAHSSVIKAAMIAGLAEGPDDHTRVRLVGTDDTGAMDTDALARTIHAVHAEGRTVMMVSATAGTTGTGAIDDALAIRNALDRAHASDHARDRWPGWLHLDAAWAGVAAICPEHRAVLAGAAQADSVCVNPHKWLLTNFDCDLFWVRDRDALVRALSITPEYLRNTQSDAGAVIDYRDWQIPLGRRFRALKLWFVLRHYGLEGLRAHIRRHIAWAEWFESQVDSHPSLELVCPRQTALVCFRLARTGSGNGDETNRALLEMINASNEVFLSHTAAPADGGHTIRFVPGATATEFRHVVRAWEIVRDAAERPTSQATTGATPSR